MHGLGLHVIALHAVRDGVCACGARCEAAGKHPRTRRWQMLPESEDVLRSDTGYGIRTGQQRSGAHLVVIDCDDAEPPADLPPTLTVATGRGAHLYYRSPTEARSRVRVRPGIDVRGTGGYVVGPWSHHATGRRYRVVRAQPPSQLPPSWVPLVERRPPPVAVPSPAAPARRGAYLERAVAEESRRVREAGRGTRNATLFAAAYSLSRLLPDDAVMESLFGAARACGLGDWESRRTIASALRRRRSA